MNPFCRIERLSSTLWSDLAGLFYPPGDCCGSALEGCQVDTAGSSALATPDYLGLFVVVCQASFEKAARNCEVRLSHRLGMGD